MTPGNQDNGSAKHFEVQVTLKALLVPFCFLATLSFGTSAFATVKLETCTLSGTILLNDDTQISCKSDLQVQAGTKIISQGFNLFIAVEGSLHMDEHMDENGPAGLEILAFDDSVLGAIHDAGRIEINAITAYGKLEIHNNGATPEDMSGSVRLEFVSVAPKYDHKIYADIKSPVNVILNGTVATLYGTTFQLRPARG